MIQSERLPCWKKQYECKLLYSHNIAEKNDMVIKLEDLREVWTDFEKFARFCTTLAMRVSVREVCSSGYSCVRLNKEGDMTAGHRKRRKREPLISRSAMSSSSPLSASNPPGRKHLFQFSWKRAGRNKWCRLVPFRVKLSVAILYFYYPFMYKILK